MQRFVGLNLAEGYSKKELRGTEVIARSLREE
jgi:hypothetical protein